MQQIINRMNVFARQYLSQARPNSLNVLNGSIQVLQQILIIARDYFRLPNVSILLLDKETNELYVRSQIGWDQKSDGVRVPIGTGLIGTAAKEKRPVYVPDVTKDPRYLPCSKKTASELAIPLMVRDEVVGVLDCQSE